MTTKVVIKPNHFTYNGIAYFRANADTVRLGAYGEKRSPLTKANYLEVKGMVPAPKLDAIEATVVDIDFRQSNAAAITLDVHPAQLEFAGGSVSAARQAASQGKLKLLKLHMLNNDMEKAINASPQVLDNLNDYGSNARVAHQIWVILNAEIADRVKTNSSASVKATIEGITIGLNGTRARCDDSVASCRISGTLPYVPAHQPSINGGVSIKPRRIAIFRAYLLGLIKPGPYQCVAASRARSHSRRVTSSIN